TCGFDEENDLRLTSVQHVQDRLRFSLDEGKVNYVIPMFGKHQAKNAAYAIAAARELHVPDREIASALKNVEITNMRFQQLKGKNDSLLINDAYNASPTAMKAAIEAVKELKGYSLKVLVLGGMAELGEAEKTFHE